ncbi:terminase small subunit [Sagittula salina]|uniref:Terminase small subunit n=1 Tax=Sagittula salina TaxID=2820268 RepID=A0A940MML4_9RHOB|nr:terminase small subunit [Sagittula salina]MBP0484660.1 terminase small subunit [Sagittula salina]
MGILPKERHEVFAQRLAAGASQVDAYEAAGYKRHAANAARLAANPDVQARVAELQEIAAQGAVVDAARVLREIGAIATSDIRRIFDATGALRRIEDLDDDTAAAIQAIKVVVRPVPGTKGREVEHVHEVKLWDKGRALDQLGKHHRLFERAGEDENPLAAFAQHLMAKAKPIPVAGQRDDSDEDEGDDDDD